MLIMLPAFLPLTVFISFFFLFLNHNSAILYFDNYQQYQIILAFLIIDFLISLLFFLPSASLRDLFHFSFSKTQSLCLFLSRWCEWRGLSSGLSRSHRHFQQGGHPNLEHPVETGNIKNSGERIAMELREEWGREECGGNGVRERVVRERKKRERWKNGNDGWKRRWRLVEAIWGSWLCIIMQALALNISTNKCGKLSRLRSVSLS